MRWSLIALLACGACGDGESTCTTEAPAVPVVSEPVGGRIDVVPAELVIASSAYSDPEGEPHAASEFEIWRMDGIAHEQLAWRASVTDPAKLTRVVLADGTGALDDWTAYAARVRYQDGCAWSEWSADLPFRTDDGSTYLFDASQVRSVYLDIPPESWAAIDAEAVGPWPYVPARSYYAGTLTFEGQVFAGVGIRVKGGCGSSRHLDGKAGLKINIAWDDPAVPGCPEERRLYGQKHVTLNNGVQDPSFERERLGYQLYRALGVPAPRAAHVRLYVNGEDWGLYLHVESLDRRFLARWFPSNEGMMYEGGPFCDVVPAQVPPGPGEDCFDMEFQSGPCDVAQPGEDPTGWELLRTLANQIAALPPGGFYTGAPAFLDVDEFLASWAVTGVIADWDGYEYGNVNNYRVYHDPSNGLWSLIQTGIDNSFDSSPGFDFWSGIAGVLAARCLEEPACTADFAAHVHAAIDRFEALDLASEAQAMHARIYPEIMTDPRKEVSSDQSQAAHDSLVSWILARPAAVRASLAARGF